MKKKKKKEFVEKPEPQNQNTHAFYLGSNGISKGNIQIKIFLISLQIGVVGTHVFTGTWFQIRYISTKKYYCRKSSVARYYQPCINKAIHALLMHGHATFNMIIPGPQICCRYEMCTTRP